MNKIIIGDQDPNQLGKMTISWTNKLGQKVRIELQDPDSGFKSGNVLRYYLNDLIVLETLLPYVPLISVDGEVKMTLEPIQ